MGTSTWRQISKVDDPRRFSEARRQAHNAAQWLARMAHSYMQPTPESSHVLLRFDAQRQALVTREFLPGFTLELRLPSLSLQFREDGRPVAHVIEIDDRTPAEVEAWVLVELLHRGIDRDRFAKALPFEIPNLMTGDAIPYVTEGLTTELGQLAGWFAKAATVLEKIGAEYPAAPASTSPGVWCWPEPFDLAVLVQRQPTPGSPRHILRAGWSPGDGAHGEPYFYVTLHAPQAGTTASSELTAAEIGSADRPEEAVLNFLRQSIDRAAN